MTSAQIAHDVMVGIDEDPASPSDRLVEEILLSINEGERVFSWLSLCLEKTSPITLTGETFSWLRPLFPDFLAPLKLMVGGRRVRPVTLPELDALNAQWQDTVGTPQRYFLVGFSLFGTYPQEATEASLTYARSPVPITAIGAQSPEIALEWHMALAWWSIYRIRLKEGAQGLARGLKYLNEFLDAATRCGDLVRNRSRAMGLDTQPVELQAFDRSRLLLKPIEERSKRLANRETVKK